MSDSEEGPNLEELSREELIAQCEELGATKTQLQDALESAMRILEELEQENEGVFARVHWVVVDVVIGS